MQISSVMKPRLKTTAIGAVEIQGVVEIVQLWVGAEEERSAVAGLAREPWKLMQRRKVDVVCAMVLMGRGGQCGSFSEMSLLGIFWQEKSIRAMEVKLKVWPKGVCPDEWKATAKTGGRV